MGASFRIAAELTAVRRRIEAECVVIESLWFPSQASQDRWYRGGRLYLRWLGPGHAEVGPCVGTPVSARFLPVVDVHLAAHPAGAEIVVGSARWPVATQVLLGVWLVVLLGWAAALAPSVGSGAERPAILVFWLVLFLATVGGGAVGARYGGEELARRLPALRQAAEDPTLEQEDW